MSVPTQTSQNGTPAAESQKLLYPDGSQQATDSQPGAPASAPVSDDVSRSEPTVDFFRDAFLRTRGIQVDRPGEATPAGDKQEPSKDGEASPGQVQTSAEGTPSPAGPASSTPAKSDADGNVITLTAEELARRVQAETDRLIAKKNHEERARREKEEEERLLDQNPFEYAQRVKKKKAEEADLGKVLEEASKATLSTMHAYDRSVVDPVILALPEEVQKEILGSTGDLTGIPERGKLVETALKRVRELSFNDGVAKARETLLQDPGFIKEVMTRYAGQVPEPDHIAAADGPGKNETPDEQMNAWIRSTANQVRGRGR